MQDLGIMQRGILADPMVKHFTVEPPIWTLRDTDHLHTADKQRALIDFAIEIINLREKDNFQSPDNGQKMCPQRTNSCTKQPPRADRDRSLGWKMRDQHQDFDRLLTNRT